MTYALTHLDMLEAESIHIIREAVAEAERSPPVKPAQLPCRA